MYSDGSQADVLSDSEIDMAYLTIESYLRGKVGYEVPDNALLSILLDREVPIGSDVIDLAQRDKELCVADLYMWCASTPSVKNKVEDADGDWKHVEGGWQTSAYDKRELRAMAKEIYGRWDDKVVEVTSVKLINL